MTSDNPYLALDLGAGSGRAVLGFFRRHTLTMQEIHRFANKPVQTNGTLYWNVLSLWDNIIESLKICASKGYNQLSGIGVDAWGSDFGLLDKNGQLLCNCVHYRDKRTDNIVKIITKKIPPQKLYKLTGFPAWKFTSLAQMAALKAQTEPEFLKSADKWLMISDLFRYFLTGKQSCELTAAGCSQLLNTNTSKWCSQIFKLFDLPFCIMPEIVKSNTIVGGLLQDVCSASGMKSCPVIAVPGHDTACASVTLLFDKPDCAFLMCGTWSIFGLISDKAITKSDACKLGFINEYGFNSFLFAKNMMGMFLTEALRQSWLSEGQNYSYAQMIKEVSGAKPFKVFLPVNHPSLENFSNPQTAIKSFLRKTGQKSNLARGELIRALWEGMAFSYRHCLEDLENVTGKKIRKLYMVGGAVRNKLFCQMIADALNINVVTGPAEATVVGSLICQRLATKKLKTLAEAKPVLENSFKINVYIPSADARWDDKFTVYKKI